MTAHFPSLSSHIQFQPYSISHLPTIKFEVLPATSRTQLPLSCLPKYGFLTATHISVGKDRVIVHIALPKIPLEAIQALITLNLKGFAGLDPMQRVSNLHQVTQIQKTELWAKFVKLALATIQPISCENNLGISQKLIERLLKVLLIKFKNEEISSIKENSFSTYQDSQKILEKSKENELFEKVSRESSTSEKLLSETKRIVQQHLENELHHKEKIIENEMAVFRVVDNSSTAIVPYPYQRSSESSFENDSEEEEEQASEDDENSDKKDDSF